MRVGKKCIVLLWVNTNSVSLPGEWGFPPLSVAELTVLGPALPVTSRYL